MSNGKSMKVNAIRQYRQCRFFFFLKKFLFLYVTRDQNSLYVTKKKQSIFSFPVCQRTFCIVIDALSRHSRLSPVIPDLIGDPTSWKQKSRLIGQSRGRNEKI
jgi:hypothetical protein